MPSSIEKLLKILKLEAELGYENRAVVGGLEKFLPVWENEARSSNLDHNLIQNVADKINAYRDLDSEKRPRLITEISELLHTLPPEKPAPARQQRAPTGSRPQPHHSRKANSSAQADDNQAATPRSKPPSVPVQQRSRRSPNRMAEPRETPGLNAPITVLSGIGPKNAQTLKALGLKYT